MRDSSSPLPCSIAVTTRLRGTMQRIAAPTGTRFIAPSTSSWSRRRRNRLRPNNRFPEVIGPAANERRPIPDPNPTAQIHEVFISGLPKLPYLLQHGLSFDPPQRYNVFGYQGFSSSTLEPCLASNLY